MYGMETDYAPVIPCMCLLMCVTQVLWESDAIFNEEDSPQQSDLRLSGPPSGEGAGDGTRTFHPAGKLISLAYEHERLMNRQKPGRTTPQQSSWDQQSAGPFIQPSESGKRLTGPGRAGTSDGEAEGEEEEKKEQGEKEEKKEQGEEEDKKEQGEEEEKKEQGEEEEKKEQGEEEDKKEQGEEEEKKVMI
ncbi:surface antigen [Plakobranchus ocellatus]|uniref:Surface antigen n=1 Tax=Plakobranchus ocellatus TaxID=259542 RepID=A0AAV4AZ25_9GAST|nr:surface antigen [Plakobranchus ocellatus]